MLRFTQVDVFTDEFLLGNPVAVIHDADALDDERMAAVARWTNLSETTFLCAPTGDADYRLRIFTTERELPFAGHPTLGSARAWLAAGGRPRRPGVIVQECGAGPVTIRQDGERLAFAAPARTRTGRPSADEITEIAAAVGAGSDDVVAAEWCDNGPGWVALLLRDADQVLALTPDPARFGRFTDIGVVGPYAPGSEVDVEVRAFFGGPDAVTEDPVTGSLNAALGQWLIAAGHLPERYLAAQGTRRHRRGRVHVERIDDVVWVGGDTVIGVRGEIALP